MVTGKADAVVTLGELKTTNIIAHWDPTKVVYPSNSKYFIEMSEKGTKNSVVRREIKIIRRESGKLEKTIMHYHYSGWPDTKLPNNPDDFEKFVGEFKNHRKLIVHCSAGVGRTGVFSGCLYALRSGGKKNIL